MNQNHNENKKTGVQTECDILKLSSIRRRCKRYINDGSGSHHSKHKLNLYNQ